MMESMLRYAIVSGTYSAGDAARLAAAGVDFLQLRDTSLNTREFTSLARQINRELAPLANAPKLFIHRRADVALAVDADGIHLTAQAEELTPQQVRAIFAAAKGSARMPGSARSSVPKISVSCHTLAEVARAHANAADLILFGPVFEKRLDGKLITTGIGLDALQAACTLAPGKVLALGGVTRANTADCMTAGAAGVAAIRLFDEGQ
jgi:thiamine-phosphate pyrophosphorylase